MSYNLFDCENLCFLYFPNFCKMTHIFPIEKVGTLFKIGKKNHCVWDLLINLDMCLCFKKYNMSLFLRLNLNFALINKHN